MSEPPIQANYKSFYLCDIVQAAPDIVTQCAKLFRQFKDTHSGVDLPGLPNSEAIGIDPCSVTTLESGSDGIKLVDGACITVLAVSIRLNSKRAAEDILALHNLAAFLGKLLCTGRGWVTRQSANSVGGWLTVNSGSEEAIYDTLALRTSGTKNEDESLRHVV